MGELEQKSTEETDEIEWNVDTEVHLLFSMVGHKPVGINKYFQMACIWNKFTSSINKNVSSDAIWKRLETMYDLATLDEAEVIPFPNDDRDFFLPEDEFSELMHEKLKSVENENPKPYNLESTTSNSSTSSSDTGAVPTTIPFTTTQFSENIETPTSPSEETSLSSILSAMRKEKGVAEIESTSDTAIFTEHRPATPNETLKKHSASASFGSKHSQQKPSKDKDPSNVTTTLSVQQKKERKISVTKLQQKEDISKKGGSEAGKEGGGTTSAKKNKKGTNTGGDESSLWKKDKEDGKRGDTPTIPSKKSSSSNEDNIKWSSKKLSSALFDEEGSTTPMKKGASTTGGDYESAGKKEATGNVSGGGASIKKDKASGRKEVAEYNSSKRTEDKTKENDSSIKKEDYKREGTLKKESENKSSRKSEGTANKNRNKDKEDGGSTKKRESLGKKGEKMEKKVSDNKEKVSSSDKGTAGNFDRKSVGMEGKKRGGVMADTLSADGKKSADVDKKEGGKSGGTKARKDKRSMDNYQSDSDSSAGAVTKKDRSKDSMIKSSAGGDSAGEEGALPSQTNKRQSIVKRPTRNTNTPELPTPNKRRRI